jgi:4-hydroxy 2-oxovalerate aldolase
MELLLGFLRNPKFNLRPVYDVLQNHIHPLRSGMEWGPCPEYMITGQLNEHPRDAIAARDSDEDRDKFLEFYDKMVVTD